MDRADKQTVVREFGKSEQDVGSTEVQVAILSNRIKEVTEHLKSNRRDHSSRRGLIAMVNRRRKLLAYLNRKDHAKYVELIKRLELRR
jgi:small subunit ribosomal protein S15